jgi:hypothetical protein
MKVECSKMLHSISSQCLKIHRAFKNSTILQKLSFATESYIVVDGQIIVSFHWIGHESVIGSREIFNLHPYDP